MELYTVKIVSKQLDCEKLGNKTVNVAKSLNYEDNSVIIQLNVYRREHQTYLTQLYSHINMNSN